MEIKIYTTPTCSWCVKLKEWLKKKKYAFQELDVTEEDVYSDEMLAKSGQLAVPVIDIDGKIIVGFHEQKIEEAIAKSK